MALSKSQLNKEIFRLAGPAILDSLAQGLTMMVLIRMIVSSQLGENALAGIGSGQILVMISMFVAMALGVGTSALVAQSVGAARPDEARRYAGHSVLIGLVWSVSFCTLIYILADRILALIGVTGEPLTYAVIYIRTVMWTVPGHFLMQVGNGAVRGWGDTRIPMFIVATAGATYVLQAWLLVDPSQPVAEGVYIVSRSRMTAQIVGGTLVLWYLFVRENSIRVGIRDVIDVQSRRVKEIVQVSLPVAGERVAMLTGFFLFNRVLWSLPNPAAQNAAHQIAMGVESVSFMPGFGWAYAATTLVGQSVGARRFDLARLAVRRTTTFAVLTMSTFGLALLLIPKFLVGTFFQPGPEVARLAATCVMIAAFEQPALAILFTIAGGLRGAGDTLSPMIVRIIGTTLFRVPMSWFMGKYLGYGVVGIWFAMVLEWWMGCAVVYYLYRSGRWKRTPTVTVAVRTEAPAVAEREGAPT